MRKPWLGHYEPGVPHTIDIPDKSVPDFLLETVLKNPGNIATSLDDNHLTYQEINERVNGFSHALLKLGIKKQDRIALLVPNSPTYVIAYYAILKIGAIVVNINVMTKGEELKEILTDSDSRLVITLDIFLQQINSVVKDTAVEHIVIHSVYGFEKKIKDAENISMLYFNELVSENDKHEPKLACKADDIAVLQYTSGTTGVPKGAMLTHRNIIASVLMAGSWVQTKNTNNSSLICLVPFFHVFGMNTCLNISVYKGYRMVLIPIFNAVDILPLVKLLEKYQPVTSFPAVPAIWAAMVAYSRSTGDNLSSIQVPSSGAAGLPPEVGNNFAQITGRKILQAYGLTEASGAVIMCPFPRGGKDFSIGMPLPNTDAKVVSIEDGDLELSHGEIGELAVKGPQVMKGYWNNPELTNKTIRDGWLFTGDIVKMDEEGQFFVIDRKDDLIIADGYNVFPSEIEELLRKHPDIRDAAVIGKQRGIRDSIITAFIEPEDLESIEKEAIFLYLEENLSRYKIPKRITFMERIPKDPTGKILKQDL